MPAAWVGAAASVVGAGTALYNATQGGGGGGQVGGSAAPDPRLTNPYASQLAGAIGNVQNADPLSQLRGIMGGNISALPGYQYQLQQGLGATQAAAASQGRAVSGNELAALNAQGQGLASTNYNSYLDQQLKFQNLVTNQLGQSANLWLSASGQQPAFTQAAAIQAQQNQMGQLMNQYNTSSNIGGITNSLSNLAGNLGKIYSGGSSYNSDPYSYGNLDYSGAGSYMGGSSGTPAFADYSGNLSGTPSGGVMALWPTS